MTYDLLLAGDLDVARLTTALAAMASVPVEAVGVAAADDEERDWSKPVLCTYEAVRGDVSWSLDVYLTEAVPGPPGEAEAATHLAAGLGMPVLYSAQSYPPSAYWLALPDGSRMRARVYDEDDALVIDAVERPVALLPHVRVDAQPEVIREHRMQTPVTDGFKVWLAAQMLIPSKGDVLWSALDRLTAWEALTVRMSSGWPPDGRYPAEYYREDLQTRDELAADVARLPAVARDTFIKALARVDDAFSGQTREAAQTPTGRSWWWRRVPDPVPWPGLA